MQVNAHGDVDVVAFDDEVRVVIAAGVLSDKYAARHAIGSLDSGGMTNLSGGLLRGMQDARRVAAGGGATLLLLCDGHANAGEIDPARSRRPGDVRTSDRGRWSRPFSGGPS